jgi:hypothetical protein
MVRFEQVLAAARTASKSGAKVVMGAILIRRRWFESSNSASSRSIYVQHLLSQSAPSGRPSG